MERSDKVYNVFISYTKADHLIAKEIQIFLKETFKGRIKPWLASDEIKSGDNWKNEIKKNLEKCDAIISLITPNSKDKPWVFVEWSAFWIADRGMHIFLSEDLSEANLIHPMQDLQYVTITNKDAIEGFLQRISKAADYRPIPYEFADDLIVQIKSALQQQEKEAFEKSFARYTDVSEPLPEDEVERGRIADYFIIGKQLKDFQRIYSSLSKDSIKFDLVKKLILKGEIKVAVTSALGIRIPETQTDVLLSLMENGVESSKYYSLIEELSKKNQTQLKYPLNLLIDRNEEEGKLFAKILASATHSITLHKVASHLIDNDKLHSATFKKVVEKIVSKNRAESRKLGEEMIDSGLEETPEFDFVVRETAKGNQIEGAKLLIYLISFNRPLYDKLKADKIITSKPALERLKEAENN